MWKGQLKIKKSRGKRKRFWGLQGLDWKKVCTVSVLLEESIENIKAVINITFWTFVSKTNFTVSQYWNYFLNIYSKMLIYSVSGWPHNIWKFAQHSRAHTSFLLRMVYSVQMEAWIWEPLFHGLWEEERETPMWSSSLLLPRPILNLSYTSRQCLVQASVQFARFFFCIRRGTDL